MIRNWIIIAWRNLKRQASSTILNTGGLALGISGSIVIFLLLSYLNSMDRYHKNADHIYRIVQETIRNGEHYYSPGIPTPFPDAFREDFQDVPVTTFISHEYRGILIGIDDPNLGMRYLEEADGVGYTQNAFFKIFDRPLIRGNVEDVLDQPNEVVVSEKLAKKMFPDESALGKEIVINKENSMVIAGVMEDFPDNTDFPFNIFISYATVKDAFLESGWQSTSSNNQLYMLLPKNVTPESVETRLVDFKLKYYEQSDSEQQNIYLQALKDIHFDPRWVNYSYRSIERSNLYAMALVGLFLILTACINYINLSTAVAMKRAKEVGVRKVLGGSRFIIMRQFISETFIVTFFSIIVSIGLAEILLGFMNSLLETEISMNLFTNTPLWIFLLSLLIGITLLAGLYPSFMLSSFKPVSVLKKMVSSKSSAGYQLRRGLVICQFVISQVFIIGTVILILQMRYVKEADLGFTTEAIINISVPEQDVTKIKTFREKLKSNSSVATVSLSNASPASGSVNMSGFTYDGEEFRTMFKTVDENYIPMFEMELLSGRMLSPSDSITEIVANEEFVRELGLQDPREAVGKVINLWDRDYPVVGIVKNFHSMSLREKIRPLLLFSNEDSYSMASVKIQSSNMQQSISDLERAFKEVYPEYSMEHEFFENDIASFYNGESRMSTLLALFSVIAIVIGCIGLYGLVSYVTSQKVKEVGIRKVLGASVPQILQLFSKEVIILIFIAFAIAAPLAGYAMKQWLNNFEYKIELGPAIFLTGIIATILIAVATVGFKTYRAATANPVESLVSE